MKCKKFARLLSSCRFYAAELDSVFGLSSPIQMSLTNELIKTHENLNSSAPNYGFYIVELLKVEVELVWLVFSIKPAIHETCLCKEVVLDQSKCQQKFEYSAL